MKREFDPATPEWMDRPQSVSYELRRDLENLAGLNRRFGSHALIHHYFNQWIVPGGRLRILDLCTGAADIPREIVRLARCRNCVVGIDAVDFQSATISLAAEWCKAYPEIHLQQADVLALNVSRDYDIVICSLALHHFSTADAVRLLRVMRDASRQHLLVADLERSALATIGVWLVTATLYREPMTRHDARVSVRRAFSFAELSAMVREAEWTHFRHARFPMFRQAISVGSLDCADASVSEG